MPVGNSLVGIGSDQTSKKEIKNTSLTLAKQPPWRRDIDPFELTGPCINRKPPPTVWAYNFLFSLLLLFFFLSLLVDGLRVLFTWSVPKREFEISASYILKTLLAFIHFWINILLVWMSNIFIVCVSFSVFFCWVVFKNNFSWLFKWRGSQSLFGLDVFNFFFSLFLSFRPGVALIFHCLPTGDVTAHSQLESYVHN